jgi:hypothetical protein
MTWHFALAGPELLKSVSLAPCKRQIGHVFAFRTDSEQNDDRPLLPACNEDLSNTCGGVHMHDSHEQIVNVSTSLFRAIYYADTIYTDRLHEAIAGSLLKERVYVFAGSYYKVKSIFQHSIEDNLPHTVWHPDFSDFPLSDCGNDQEFPGACSLGKV